MEFKITESCIFGIMVVIALSFALSVMALAINQDKERQARIEMARLSVEMSQNQAKEMKPGRR